MRINMIKDIIDLLQIIVLTVTIIILNFIDNIIICLIPIVLVIVLYVIERIIWRCPNCGCYLPNKSLFNKVICCPYCKIDIK